ncbi:hypothetical protein P5P86_11855 [Nocardioides sp. BP30]|uniref:hypothetical protein n=1 Tax=Nocardioides sp. BP30 TaxID=3036374 RepID=UPI0024694BCC|nr:hypothetical protein [Nocardioides sp. BP30]WGL50658.1 hypothetical protein P5P86_11855 [Nocardioides sp. BP30]
MRYTTRPLSDRTWLRPASARKRARFDATWSQTLALLGREIEHLKGRDVVIEVDVREQDIRLDGQLRANAKAETPAVVVAFESAKHGPMLYRADSYAHSWTNRPGWQENARAIALTLEALRAVDRYGATETGQQYTGFKALPAGRAMPASHMTRDEALALLWKYGRTERDAGATTGLPGSTDAIALARYHRAAKAAAHPDRHSGDRTLWDQIEQAAHVLGLVR